MTVLVVDCCDLSLSLSLSLSSSQVVLNLAEAGYSRPTPVQMFTVPMVLTRRDVLVCAPTGSGKSEYKLHTGSTTALKCWGREESENYLL